MPALQSGSHVGPYEILAPIGAGGMGEVYRSRDTKLKREVAIKVLPAEFSRDPERIQRFQREAEVLATLNHPHIAQIHGVEESGGMLCLVLELVEGETLADRLQRGAIPVEEALELGRQIAEALEAAHQRDIVHRDLKPANIKITPDGKVKVLDFGLAKAVAPESFDGNLSQSPTLVTGTMPGVILGTAQYMSPEQAKGRAANMPSDIWAFGCVLFEMLAGKPAFAGETVVEILSATLRADPDWTSLPSVTPPGIRSLVKRCLQKEQKRRLRDIADARFLIEEALDEPARGATAAIPTRRGRERLLWLAAMVVVAVVSVLSIMSLRRPANDAQEMHVQIISPRGAQLLSFAISPDGRKIVFVATKDGKNQLWLRTLDSETPQLVTGTDNAVYPFWSPDSKSLAFFADGQLKRIDIAGGIAQRVASAPQARGGSWGLDGTILFSPATNQPLYRVAAGGGQAVPAVRLDPPRQVDQRVPQFLPDGRHFLFYGLGTPESRGVYTGSLDSMDTRRLFDADSAAVFLPPDHVVFAREQTLFGQRFDLKKLETVGDPFPITERVSVHSPNIAALGASASMAGTLAYQQSTLERQLFWLDRSGQRLGTLGGIDSAQPARVRVSPDQRTIVLERTVSGNTDLWLSDVSRGIPRHFVSTAAIDEEPVWSNDGTRIAFGSDPKGVVDIYEKPVDGAGAETLLLSSPEHKHPNDWSPDGRFILYTSQTAKAGYDLWALPLFGDRKPFPLAQMAFDEMDARFSPDGRWIAYVSNETGQYEIVIRPFPGPGAPTPVTTTGGGSPQWRSDGRELFYLGADNRLMAVSIALNGQKIEIGTPVSLFPVRSQSEYVAAPDGQRFLITAITEEVSTISLILNWKPPAK